MVNDSYSYSGSPSNVSEPQPSPQPSKSLDNPMFGNDVLELDIGVDGVDYLALDMGEEKEQDGIVSYIGSVKLFSTCHVRQSLKKI